MDVILRKEAKLLGLKWYFTGKTCKHGHVAKRRIDDCVCLECKRIKDKIVSKTGKRKEYHREYHKRYYAANAEQIKEYGREYSSEYRKLNPEKIAMHCSHYLSMREQATPQWYEANLIKQLYLKRNELSEIWGITLHVDHVVPLKGKLVCGLHCWDNLQILEANLNQSKGNNFNNQ